MAKKEKPNAKPSTRTGMLPRIELVPMHGKGEGASGAQTESDIHDDPAGVSGVFRIVGEGEDRAKHHDDNALAGQSGAEQAR